MSWISYYLMVYPITRRLLFLEWIQPHISLTISHLCCTNRVPLRNKPTVSPTVGCVGLSQLYSLAANLLLMVSGYLRIVDIRGSLGCNSATQHLPSRNNLRSMTRHGRPDMINQSPESAKIFEFESSSRRPE